MIPKAVCPKCEAMMRGKVDKCTDSRKRARTRYSYVCRCGWSGYQLEPVAGKKGK
jgi:hypothetical protein